MARAVWGGAGHLGGYRPLPLVSFSVVLALTVAGLVHGGDVSTAVELTRHAHACTTPLEMLVTFTDTLPFAAGSSCVLASGTPVEPVTMDALGVTTLLPAFAEAIGPT
jgi:hypothetical protein